MKGKERCLIIENEKQKIRNKDGERGKRKNYKKKKRKKSLRKIWNK